MHKSIVEYIRNSIKGILVSFLVCCLAMACTKQKQPSPRIPIYPRNDIAFSTEQVVYCDKQAPVTPVTLVENGETYEVEAIGGQIMLFFKHDISHQVALGVIEQTGAQVIAQMPYLKHYLVEVPLGTESNYVAKFGDVLEIDYAYPNVIEYNCTASSVVIDNFHGDHGDRVTAMISECNPLPFNHGIKTYDVAAQDDEFLNMHEAIEAVEQTLSRLPNGEGVTINISFGPRLVRLWEIIPWQKRVLWNDRFVTDSNHKSYIRKYHDGLKLWIKTVAKFNDKDFVIVKSSGNEGVKQLEIILDGLMAGLTEQEAEVFRKHFIIVSAKDDNKEGDYPNDVSSYHPMVTKVDISDMTDQDLHWQGTSYAAPRVVALITQAANTHYMKTTDVLTHVRAVTESSPDHLLTYEQLEQSIETSLYPERLEVMDTEITPDLGAQTFYAEINNELVFTLEDGSNGTVKLTNFGLGDLSLDIHWTGNHPIDLYWRLDGSGLAPTEGIVSSHKDRYSYRISHFESFHWTASKAYANGVEIHITPQR